MDRPRLILADDHMLVAEGISRILEPDFEIVKVVSNGRELLDAVDQVACDLVLLDVSMPMLNGIDAGRILKVRHPRIKLLYVSMHSSADYLWEAFRAGGSGYVLKRAASTELKTAIHKILKGGTYIGSSFTSQLRVPVDAASSSGRPLTTRQREVVQLIAEGHSGKQIASQLGISAKTVEFHKASILAQLGLRTTADLIRYALEKRIVSSMME